jgi:hypothetical protein
LPAALEANG